LHFDPSKRRTSVNTQRTPIDQTIGKRRDKEKRLREETLGMDLRVEIKTRQRSGKGRDRLGN